MANNQIGIYHRAVDYALDILEQFNGDADELSLTDLTKKLNINKNNVFRILTTLKARHYISKNRDNGYYRLGHKTVTHGQTFKKQMALLRKAKPVIEGVVSTCNESTFVANRKEFQAVYLDSVESNHAIRVVPRLGIHLPLHCTAAGKILLAYMSDREQEKHLLSHELTRYTPNTITDRELLEKHLLQVAEQGYAVDNEELDHGVRCVSAPVQDYKRRLIGAISISGPSTRFPLYRIETELIPLVRKAAQEISISHGYPGEPDSRSFPGLTLDVIVNSGMNPGYPEPTRCWKESRS